MSAVSLFDMFSIGIGPSSSHTVGPMRAAKAFVDRLSSDGLLTCVVRMQAELYGSLALTGLGHGTDKAVIMGLQGALPDSVDPNAVISEVSRIRRDPTMLLAGERNITFNVDRDLVFHFDDTLPRHVNGLRMTAYDSLGQTLLTDDYYSIGGGFIMRDADFDANEQQQSTAPYPFETAEELLALCRKHDLTIAQLMMANECAWRDEAEVIERLKLIDQVMEASLTQGCQTDGILPGKLEVNRRAPQMYRQLCQQEKQQPNSSVKWDWLNVYAIAVNEENAAGGRVVTAPTNGGAGTVPSVLNYYKKFCPGADEQGVLDFLLTAGAIAILYKKGASISAAEMGCQGEIGVACSMAAGAITAVSGGNLNQVENAAEIGIEHNLGMTCDPVEGLVQIPCIERNAMGAIKAVNASRLAFAGDGTHKVFLDKAINTMRQTGNDMKSKYKETSQGGLAVNVPEC